MERRARPSFDGWTVYNVYHFGAKGDGVTDDTTAIQAALAAVKAPNAVVFFPQGSYIVSATLNMQPGTALVGEVMSVITAKGGAAPWTSAATPAPLVATAPGAAAYIVDIMFSASNNVPGCILLDWSSTSDGGIWDSHWRLEYTAHTLFNVHDAPATPAGGYFENMWGWVADHDIDTGSTLNVTNPNGFRVSSTGNTWWYATAAEHSYLSQYNFTGAANVVTVVTQTESPYWQIPPTALAMNMQNVAGVQMYGSGSNWFNGNQSSVFAVSNASNMNTFAINVHGVNSVVVTDTQGTVQAYTPVEKEWFCDGYAVYTGMA
jgi:glucan 1,3-beta-glucosidase